MAGRGPQSFKKRQKEQLRKEKQQEKLAKRLQRKNMPEGTVEEEDEQEYEFPAVDREFPELEADIHAPANASTSGT